MKNSTFNIIGFIVLIFMSYFGYKQTNDLGLLAFLSLLSIFQLACYIKWSISEMNEKR